MQGDALKDVWGPFTQDASDRVKRHPDTPAAYVRWSEIMPLLNRRWATEIGNRLGWSLLAADKPIGASHDMFRGWLCIEEDSADRFMLDLAETPVIDFIDGALPLLMNCAGLGAADRLRWLRTFESQKDAHRLAWPESVLVELTQSCNFSCVMCSHRGGGYDRGKTMPLPVFGELVRQFSPHAKSFRVNGYGESTVLSDLGAYMDCFEEFNYGGQKEIITNLSGDTQLYERMIREGYALIVSWDAADKALFESIRRGADFDSMKDRLRHLCGMAKAHPEQVVLLCTVQERNCHAIPEIVDFARQAGAGVVIYNMVKEEDGSPWMTRRFSEIAGLFGEAAARATATGVQIRMPDHVGTESLRVEGVSRTSACGCDRPWSEVLIRYDLEIQPCNMFNPCTYGLMRLRGWELDLGQRFDNLWNSRIAATFRALVNSHPRHPYCDRCYWLHRSS